MKIAIITVNYNGKKDTLEFLESLNKLPTTGYQLLTVVVDNASTDGSVSNIKAQYPDVDIIQTGKNLGFSGGYNKGIEYAQIWGADYFLIINNDTLIQDANLLYELVKTAESDKSIALVSPKIYFAPGFEFHKERYSQKDLGKVLWYGGGYLDWNNVLAVHRGIDEVDSGKYTEAEETDFVSGACMLIKREIIEKVGKFDEKYFLYFEDSDFQKRVTDTGFKKYYCGKVAIYHKVSQSTGIGSELTDYFHSRNRLILGFKFGKLRTKFALLRQALILFFFGRPAQRRGILDFYLGIRGGVNVNHLEGDLDSHPLPQYPIKLSIGIVNYNTADLTKKLLQSIFKTRSHIGSGKLDNMEVLVLDNGSSDNCKDVIKDFLPRIKFLENKENEGFSKGYNKTIKYSLGEYYLMLNSDIEVTKNGLYEMIKAEDELGGNAVLGGRLYFPDRSNQDSAYHLPTIWGAFKEYFLGKLGSYFMYMPKGKKPIQVEGVAMACFLIPRIIINKVGYLDEGTFIFFEDIEYCRRLKKYDVPIYFIPSAKFIHHHGGATKKLGQEKANRLLRKGAIYYHGSFYYLLLTSVLWFGQKLGRVKTPVSRFWGV